jgi:hypothetical protein
VRSFRFTAGEWLTLALVGAGALIWFVRLEGRVNAQDLQIRTTATTSQQENKQIREDLQYIRQRLDLALDGAPR